jgi:hypothetical protein|eukprot:COSAG01_NODE_8700_length_2692_cov_3.016123_4_plen_67_part_00
MKWRMGLVAWIEGSVRRMLSMGFFPSPLHCLATFTASGEQAPGVFRCLMDLRGTSATSINPALMSG